MDFETLISESKNGNNDKILALMELYTPLLCHESMINGKFDEDLMQELKLTFLDCIRSFNLTQ